MSGRGGGSRRRAAQPGCRLPTPLDHHVRGERHDDDGGDEADQHPGGKLKVSSRGGGESGMRARAAGGGGGAAAEEPGPTSLASLGSPRELQAAAAQQCQPPSLSLALPFSLLSLVQVRGPPTPLITHAGSLGWTTSLGFSSSGTERGANNKVDRLPSLGPFPSFGRARGCWYRCSLFLIFPSARPASLGANPGGHVEGRGGHTTRPAPRVGEREGRSGRGRD